MERSLFFSSPLAWTLVLPREVMPVFWNGGWLCCLISGSVVWALSGVWVREIGPFAAPGRWRVSLWCPLSGPVEEWGWPPARRVGVVVEAVKDCPGHLLV